MFETVDNAFAFIGQGFAMGCLLWGLSAFVIFCRSAGRWIGGSLD